VLVFGVEIEFGIDHQLLLHVRTPKSWAPASERLLEPILDPPVR
jgi:hypothetical protein